MAEHKVRRLPVIDEHRMVGIISQADIATNIDEEKVGDLVEAISARAVGLRPGGAPRRRPGLATPPWAGRCHLADVACLWLRTTGSSPAAG